jgi:hypothetical protein
MIKSFAALAILSLLGAAVAAWPAFAPPAKASEAVGPIKADRLPVRSVHRDCAQQVWPYLQTSCLRNDAGTKIGEARLIIARR